MLDSSDNIARALSILNSVDYLTVATVTPEGQPWNSPVFGVHDNELNFFWFSDKENQHSINVRASKSAFIVIYDSSVPEGDGEGVYLQVAVAELDDPDEILYARRLKKGPNVDTPDGFMGDSVRRAYKATPLRAWINDAEVKEGVFIRDYKVELVLDDLRKKQ